MELIIKHFSELTAEELMQIYKLRIAVFVVEQNCPYQDIDGWDPHAYHLWLKDADSIQAYLRVLPQNTLLGFCGRASPLPGRSSAQNA